ncbi:MFS transporter [Larkinella bovis]|uniref:MFS transporter n=1 Tax=Larkinella bovis TaxID=683041 RepID=A0ABW0IDD0_9BACT
MIFLNNAVRTTSKSYAWLVVGLLSIVGCLNYLDRMMITTMRFTIVESIPMTDAQFGLLSSLFLWIYGFLSPLGGFLADRFKRTWVIIGSLLVWSAVTWATSYVTTYEGLLVTRALMGISEACYIPAGLAMIMDYHPGASRSLANSIHLAGIMIGSSLGFVGGWLAESYSWNFAFNTFGVIGVVYAFVLWGILREAPKQDLRVATEAQPSEPNVSFSEAVRYLLKNKEYFKALTIWGIAGIVVWLVGGWLPTYFKEQFSLSQSMAGLYSTGYLYTASLIGVITGGFLADRWGKRDSKRRIYVPILGYLIASPAIFFASSSSILYPALAGFILFAFFRVFLDANMMPILTLIIDKKYLATGYGILNFISCLIGGLSLYAGGVIRDMNIDISILFKISSGIMIMALFLLWRLKPTTESREERLG